MIVADEGESPKRRFPPSICIMGRIPESDGYSRRRAYLWSSFAQSRQRDSMKQFQKLIILFIFTVAQPELLLATPLEAGQPAKNASLGPTIQWGHCSVSRYLGIHGISWRSPRYSGRRCSSKSPLQSRCPRDRGFGLQRKVLGVPIPIRLRLGKSALQPHVRFTALLRRLFVRSKRPFLGLAWFAISPTRHVSAL